MIVVDASISLSWFFSDEASPERQAILARVLKETATAPHQWRMEAANVLTMGLRRGRLTRAGLRASLEEILSLPVEIDATTPERVHAAVEIAEHHQLTVYDAAYLELALRRKLALATLDKKLAAAARAESVEVLP